MTHPTPWHALVVDDDRLARRDLRLVLDERTDVIVLAEAEDLASATTLLARLDVDLVFLDIRLGRANAFDLLPAIEPNVHVVFVTAYDEYAVRAFEVNALDYLLKPVEPERLNATLDRLAAGAPPPPDPTPRLTYQDHLLLDTGAGLAFTPLDTIRHVRASRQGSILYLTDGKQVPTDRSLSAWERRLPSSHFVRIHRSHLVNVTHVDRIEPWSHYTYRLHLRHVAESLPVSRRYGRRLRTSLR